MPGSIYDWSMTAGQNDTADADIDWREGMFPDAVNDSARQMMGRSAEWRNDITGTLIAGGTANTLILTANSAFKSLANGRMLTFRAAANNTGPVTMNVNGLGAKAIRVIGPAGDVDLVADDLKAGCPCALLYSSSANGGAGAWIVVSATRAIGNDRVDAFPVGTRLLFQQSAAPTGWTKDVTQDNKALRLVSGTVTTGGTVSFTTAFSSARPTTSVAQGGTVGGTALTAEQIPGHAHGPGNLSGYTSTNGHHAHGPGNLQGPTDVQGNHTHNFGTERGEVGTGLFGVASWIDEDAVYQTAFNPAGAHRTLSIAVAGAHAHSAYMNAGATAGAGDHNHTVALNGGATAVTGGGQAHTHTLTPEAHSHATDLAVQYVDVIICEKAA